MKVMGALQAAKDALPQEVCKVACLRKREPDLAVTKEKATEKVQGTKRPTNSIRVLVREREKRLNLSRLDRCLLKTIRAESVSIRESKG